MKAGGYIRVGVRLVAHQSMRSSRIIATTLLVLALATWLLSVYNTQPANGTKLTASSVKYEGFSYADGSFRAVASDDHLHMVSGTLLLRQNTRYLVRFEVVRAPTSPAELFVDLYAPGYDNPEQEIGFKLGYEALPNVLTGGFSTGTAVPEQAELRLFYFGQPGLEVRGIYIAQVPSWRLWLQNTLLCLALVTLLALLVVFARWVFDAIKEEKSSSAVSTRTATSMGCLYAVIVLVRFVVAWLQPYWSGDEYVYKAIASGIWAYGHAGRVSPDQLLQSLNLPNLLYPYLIAPAFAFGSEFYTAVKLINALVVSAALIPVYLIARRVIGHRASLTVAVISCLLPSVNIAAYAVTEVLYFPLFLLCVWLAVRALESPLSAVRNLLLGIAIGVLFNVKLNAMVVMPAYLMVLLIVATLDRNLSSLVRRPMWIVALLTMAITYFMLRAVLGSGEVEDLGIYESQSGGWLSSSLRTAIADPTGLLRLISGHLTILAIPYSVGIASAARILSDKPVNVDDRARVRVILLLSLVFLSTVALTILFTLSVSSHDLGGLGRWHSRYYFMALPLVLICGFAVPSARSSSLATKVVYWSTFGALVVGFLYFLLAANGLDDPWFGSAVDSMEVQWFRLSSTLLYVGLALTIMVAFTQMRTRHRWPLLVLLIVWLLIANYGALTVMHRSPTADAPQCGSLAYRVLSQSPGRVALVVRSRADLVDTAFWLPVAPDKAIMLEAYSREFDASSLKKIDYILTEDGVVVSGASKVVEAGNCRIYKLE